MKGTVDARIQDRKADKDSEIDELMDSHNKQEKLPLEELMRLFGKVGEDEDGRPFIFARPSNDDERFDLSE